MWNAHVSILEIILVVSVMCVILSVEGGGEESSPIAS